MLPTAPLDEMKFTLAWASLCGVASDSTTGALAPKILAAAAAAKSDPFTLAALARYGSHCDAGYKREEGRRLRPARDRARACTAPAGAPELPVDKADLTSKRLLDPDVNLAVGAALLEMWNASHKELDAAFGGGLHRSGVSHFVWGDVVRSSGQEDLILTARRRMIENYLGNKDAPRMAPVHRRADRVAAGGGAARGDQRAGRRSFGRRAPPRRAGHRRHARRAGARDRRRHRDLRRHQQPQPARA